MDDSGIPRGWDDLDGWIRRECEILVREGFPLPPSLAISFVGDRPDLFLESPPNLEETWRETVRGLIDVFGAIRPERLVVVWPNMFELDGVRYFAARLNLAEKERTGRWSWRTRLHPYVLDPDDPRRIAEWGPAFDLDDPPDPGSRQLRQMFTARTYRRLLRRGQVTLPPDDDWDFRVHPESTTVDGWEYLHSLPEATG